MIVNILVYYSLVKKFEEYAMVFDVPISSIRISQANKMVTFPLRRTARSTFCQGNFD